MTKRSLVLTIVLLSFWGWLEVAARPTPPPRREPLAALPRTIDEWTGRDAPPLEARVLEILGADDYVVRTYQNPNTSALLSLYLGYHDSQRQDASIHSPMSCLPGAGWTPVRTDRIQMADTRGPQRTATINRVIVQKGEERQLVLYWYQSHGRIVASEYVSKAYLFADAMRTGRTDAALVRIMSPFGTDGERTAQLAATQFAGVLLPHLELHLPN